MTFVNRLPHIASRCRQNRPESLYCHPLKFHLPTDTAWFPLRPFGYDGGMKAIQRWAGFVLFCCGTIGAEIVSRQASYYRRLPSLLEIAAVLITFAIGATLLIRAHPQENRYLSPEAASTLIMPADPKPDRLRFTLRTPFVVVCRIRMVSPQFQMGP